MKLTKNEIDVIIDEASEPIYDDLWNELGTEWVEDYLSDATTNEYDNEDIDLILEGIRDYQKQIQEEAISEEKQTLYQSIDEFIDDNDDIHLSLDDIGKVLVKLASSYLGNE